MINISNFYFYFCYKGGIGPEKEIKNKLHNRPIDIPHF